MSSPYPILGNRPIDQWKVTELKEELKRRKLMTKGLKDDLIRRLDEAIRIEQQSSRVNADAVNVSDSSRQPEVQSGKGGTFSSAGATAEQTHRHHNLENKSDPNLGTNDSSSLAMEKVSTGAETASNAGVLDENQVSQVTVTQTRVVVSETEVTKIVLGGPDLQKNDHGNEIVDQDLQKNDDKNQTGDQYLDKNNHEKLESGDQEAQLETEGLKLGATAIEEKHVAQVTASESSFMVTEVALSGQDLQIIDGQNKSGGPDIDVQPQTGVSKSPNVVSTVNSSEPDNQVSEANPVLGFQVKSDSISTESVSINENFELKDTVIADNVKLEQDVKPETLQQSSSNVIPVTGDSHPMDVEEPLDNKISPGKTDGETAENVDVIKKNDSGDVGSPEKLNLDRSSGDDSMEEDVLDTKQSNSDETRDIIVKTEEPILKEDDTVDIVGNDAPGAVEAKNVENHGAAVVSVKRKLNDKEVVANSDTAKRQRKWNPDSLKVPEPEGNSVASTTPKSASQPNLGRSFSRSDSTVGEETPKERVVPPASRSPTNSLRIDRFLRPFTLKAVQELLGKTGSVTSFWMDHIKTHCYVSYASVEEAVETRNAVFNLQWPPNGGKLLVAEFVDPQEVKARVEAPPPSPATPLGAGPAFPPAPATMQQQPQLQPSPRQQVQRQKLPPPPPPQLSNPPLNPVREHTSTVREHLPAAREHAQPAKERLTLPPPPPLPDKVDAPIVTLDDLFRKTKATPRIYYLPLTDEQVSVKLRAQGKNVKQ